MDIRPPERTATSSERLASRNGALLRTAAWGICASFAAAVLVFVAQTPAGGERIKQAMAGTDEAVAVPAESDPMVRALEARVAALTADRDRLVKRVAALETGVSDLTGSVRRQAAAAPSSTPAMPAPIAAVKEPVPMIVAVAPPLINPLATPAAGVASLLPEPAPAAAPVAEPPPEIPTPTKAPPEAMVPESAAPEAAAADDAPTGSIPAQAERKASDAARTAGPARARQEYGVELATEANMEGLRKRWAGVKANHGPLLVGLSPVAVRDQHPGSTNVRLVAGPLPSLAAARQLCARFAAVNGNCWPARINPSDVVQR